MFRVIRTNIQTLDELSMPPVLKTFCKQKRGLILVTGPTGSGKSTTLAAMVDFINEDRKEHIITIEDPVEFVHPQKKCLISQREIGLNADSFAGALRSSLREDANVVLVGELRDLETIGLAVTAAETGILVLATLHTSGAAATVDRMVSVFPAAEQSLIRSMLSTSLCGVVSQQLVRRVDGKGMLAAVEVLVNNAAVANILREGKTDLLTSVIQSGALVGMQTLDSSLRRLLDAKRISGSEAYRIGVQQGRLRAVPRTRRRAGLIGPVGIPVPCMRVWRAWTRMSACALISFTAGRESLIVSVSEYALAEILARCQSSPDLWRSCVLGASAVSAVRL